MNLRLDRGIRQQELAKACGVTPGAIGPLAYFAAIQGISSRMPERTEKLLRSYLSDDRGIARAVAASILFKGTTGAQKYVPPERLGPSIEANGWSDTETPSAR